jgi:hypothetical protein
MLTKRTSSLLHFGITFLVTLTVHAETDVLTLESNAMTEPSTPTLLQTDADSAANSQLAVMELRTEERNAIEEQPTTTQPLELELLKLQELAELIVIFHIVEIELSISERIVIMETNNLEMDVLLIVPLNVVMEESILVKSVTLEQLSTTKDFLTVADLDVLTSFVVMVSEILMNNVITELQILILPETPVVPTAEILSVVTVSSITENNVIPLTMLFVHPIVPQLHPLVETEELIPERPVMLELEILPHLQDVDLTVLSPSVVMVSVIPELSPLVLHLQLFTTKLVILSVELLLATLKHVPTLVVMELLVLTNNAISVVELELNQTTELDPTNAERDVSSPSVVMVSLILMRNVILEPAMV